ncbi:endonuclease/exonuclease/phosphatase family protein [Sphingomonas sp. S1-29]|uniref:endonuclease/exonuclease/phosphatase family protein n=1 Tax=Sphingomonas sp. S1-29 TaxID=2991074 RepID=UPI0022404C26|nr:endonuclease/exonuclease/phosphatase family protein [Sphingomonas sp. S1-29]UZK69752.1 endonuclease/exonuclease/phosphatase family protein [Sphingomonas sp. S1-29]
MLTLASYNMHKAVGTDRRRRPERTLEVLREIDADIVALQEADRRFGTREAIFTPHLLAEHSDYKAVPVAVRALSMGWHGNVLLVRREAEIVDCTPIHLPALEPRGAVSVDVRLRGITVRVVGMHLDLSGLWRRRQAHAILSHLDGCTPLPTILMGDLNEWRPTAGCVQDFCRSFTQADTGASFHAKRPIARLDRIMVSRDLEIAECGVHRSMVARTASDHLPIWAKVATRHA